MHKVIALIALIGVVGWFVVGRAQEPAIDTSSPPEIQAEAFLNADSPPSLAALRGESVVLVEFWATWCPPCKRSIPHLNELHGAYADRGLVIIGLTNEDRETVERFQQDMPMAYIVGVGSRSGEDYMVRGIPHAFLIDVDGEVVWQGHPLHPDMPKAIEEAMEALPAAS